MPGYNEVLYLLPTYNPDHARVIPRLDARAMPNVRRREQEDSRSNKRHAGLGKRLRSVGFLRPNVLLYGEESPDEAQIVDTFNKDLHHPIDAVIVVGTRLYIRSLRQYVEDI
jgi:NAD-dependent SIR2 family protein deacetylase